MTNPNDPAFSTQVFRTSEYLQAQRKGFPEGLTKREYFAGLAMQGIAKYYPASDIASVHIKDFCIMAVCYADALITELNKEAKP